MEDYILLLLVFMAGAYLGWKINDAFTRITFGKMLEEAGVTNADLDKFLNHWKPKMEAESKSDSSDLPEIEIKVEKHGSELYAFRKDNDQFLGQGPTKEALVEAMSKKLNNVRCSIVEGSEYLKQEA